MPKFENISDGFQVTVFDGFAEGNRSHVVEDVVNNVADKYLSAKQIAAKLNIAPRTAQHYLRLLINKKN